MKKVILLTVAALSISSVFAQVSTNSIPKIKINKNDVVSINLDVCTDNGSKAPAANVAFYKKPLGTYYAGITQDFGIFTQSMILGPTEFEWEFRKTTQNTSAVHWTLGGESLDEWVNAAGNFVDYYDAQYAGYYFTPAPTITTTVAGNTTSYTFLATKNGATAPMGPTSEDKMPLSNVIAKTDSSSSGYDIWYSSSQRIFGSDPLGGNTRKIYGFKVNFEKPMTHLVVDTIYLIGYTGAGSVPFASGVTLKAEVVTVVGTTEKVIATSIISASNLESLGDDDYLVPFVFKTVDDLGIETAGNIVIADQFYVYVSGLEKAGLDIGFYFSQYNVDGYRTFMMGTGSDGTWTYQGHLNPWMMLNGYFDPAAVPTQPSGVSNVNVQLSHVVNTPSEIQLSYPADFNSVALYSASGQMTAQYTLPTEGHFNISAQNLPKGVYMLRFEGAKSETVKIVR
ncbi:MAG: T9SS type A sorting domain-containing protein [Paludibacter sp.]|nr:T9SS type A sorting domain-containing protein [Paludibacter sp.]